MNSCSLLGEILLQIYGRCPQGSLQTLGSEENQKIYEKFGFSQKKGVWYIFPKIGKRNYEKYFIAYKLYSLAFHSMHQHFNLLIVIFLFRNLLVFYMFIKIHTNRLYKNTDIDSYKYFIRKKILHLYKKIFCRTQPSFQITRNFRFNKNFFTFLVLKQVVYFVSFENNFSS